MNIDRILLLTTTQCTLNCDYCYMKRNNHQRMSEKVALDSVSWAFENSKGPRLSIEFFGGDPLCNMELIEPVVEYSINKSKKAPDISKFWMTAFLNGYNDNLNKFLDIACKNKNLFHLQFSMDGCKEAQDCGRNTYSGKSSFEEVVKSMNIVRERFGRLQIHAVITPDNAKYINKSVDFMLSMGCSNIEFGLDRDNRWTKKTLMDFDNEIKILSERYIGWIKNNKNIAISMLLNPIHAIINGKTTGCYIGRSGFLIGCKGEIYPCQRMEKFGKDVMMGSIYSGIKKDKIDYWNCVNCQNMQGCKECELYGICIGSCSAANYEYNGSPLIPIKNSCLLYKTIYREAIRVFDVCRKDEIYRMHLERLGMGWKKI